jgi:hypothetical protein
MAAFGTLTGNLDVPGGIVAEKYLAEVAATERPSPTSFPGLRPDTCASAAGDAGDSAVAA